MLFFPISYIFGDILTEVYGYGRDRRVVWAGFAALVFASVMAVGGGAACRRRAAIHEDYQASLESVFGNDLAHRARLDDRVLVRQLRQLLRAGEDEALDAGTLALDAHHRLDPRRRGGRFVALLSDRLLRHLGDASDCCQDRVAQYVLKTGWEVVMTPVTYKVVGFLKRAENEDYYDRDTDFSPFRLS